MTAHSYFQLSSFQTKSTPYYVFTLTFVLCSKHRAFTLLSSPLDQFRQFISTSHILAPKVCTLTWDIYGAEDEAEDDDSHVASVGSTSVKIGEQAPEHGVEQPLASLWNNSRWWCLSSAQEIHDCTLWSPIQVSNNNCYKLWMITICTNWSSILGWIWI